MANFAQLLKEEIIRLSKKEVRTAMQPVLNAIQTLRKANAEQKKKLEELEQMFQKCLSYSSESGPSSDEKSSSLDKKTRLGAGGIIRIRKRLALDRQTMARLLGVNPNSIFLWEHGKNKPRPQMRMKILALRNLSKKDIQEHLKELAEEVPAPEENSIPTNKPTVPEKELQDSLEVKIPRYDNTARIGGKSAPAL